jgi:acetolactate synthase-1/2/3 large subunit
MDSIPMVIISGQVPTHAIGQDAFQECDTVGITRPCVKHNFLIKKIEDIDPTIKKAFYIASSGRPGPVVVDIPKDITAEEAIFEYPTDIDLRSYNPVQKGHQGQITKALELLVNAEKPMVYTGGGVVLGDASTPLTKLMKKLGFPVTSTLMGLGGFPANEKQFLGMLGMHGTYEANMAMQECDVLIAIGSRFDDRVIGNPDHFLSKSRKIIHIDIDPASISKRVKIDIPIVGNVNNVLEDMIDIYSTLEKNMTKKFKKIGWPKLSNGGLKIHYLLRTVKKLLNHNMLFKNCTESPKGMLLLPVT